MYQETYRSLLLNDLDVLRQAEDLGTRVGFFAICEANRRLRFDIESLGGMAGEW